jgi:hypothetical protein
MRAARLGVDKEKPMEKKLRRVVAGFLLSVFGIDAVRAASDNYVMEPAPAVSAGSGHGSAITWVDIQNLEARAADNVPVTLSHIFGAGDCPSNVTIYNTRSGQFLPTQTDIKVRYTDGSIKHALISFALPRLEANEAGLRLELRRGGANNAYSLADAPTDAQMRDLLSSTAFNMSVTYSGAENRTVSARDLIGTSPFWIKGAVSSEFLLADMDPSRQLITKFNVRTYPGWNGMRVMLVVENSWANRTGTPITYNVTVTATPGGAALYQENNVRHYHYSRWVREIWLGQAPPRMNIKYNVPYLVSTRLIPNYDTSLVVPESTLGAAKGRWDALRSDNLTTNPNNIGARDTNPISNKGILGNGFSMFYFPTTGGREEIGLNPTWATRYLLSMDWRLRAITLENGFLSGSIPVHAREFDSSKSFYKHVISLDNRPNIQLGGDGDAGITPPPSYSQPWSVDRSHQANFATLPYILSGEHYFLEELYFWAAYDLACGTWERHGSQALITDQVRGEAWAIRNIANAAALAPDGDIEKSYLTQKLNNNLTAWETKYIASGSHPLHPWGLVSNRGEDGGRPDDAVTLTVRASASPWQEDFMVSVLGHLTELGFPAGNLLNWLGAFTINRLTHPDFNPFAGTSYRMPMTYTASGYSLSPELNLNTWSAVRDSYVSNLTGLGGDYAYAYSFIAHNALSFLQDLPNAPAAWRFVHENITPSLMNDDPTWAMVPRVPRPTSFSILTGSLRQAATGFAYSYPLAAAGGQTPYTWSVTGLPAGLSLNPTTGIVFSSPTASGSFSFTVQARDSVGNTASRSVTMEIAPDEILPQVHQISPSASTILTSTVTFVSFFSDTGSGVAQVKYQLNGSDLYSTTGSASASRDPYDSHAVRFVWYSGSWPNGTYNLTAVALDKAGNVGVSSSISVTLSNSGGGGDLPLPSRPRRLRASIR